MAATYTPIASITLGTATGSVTFSNIPQTYTDLVLVYNGTSAVSNLPIRFNSDTGSNYAYTRMYAEGTTTGTDSEQNLTYAVYAIGSSAQTNAIAHINNYSNTTTNKVLIGRGNYVTSGYVSMFGSLWRSTAAITSITLLGSTSSANFAVGSRFDLYGILGANA